MKPGMIYICIDLIHLKVYSGLDTAQAQDQWFLHYSEKGRLKNWTWFWEPVKKQKTYDY